MSYPQQIHLLRSLGLGSHTRSSPVTLDLTPSYESRDVWETTLLLYADGLRSNPQRVHVLGKTGPDTDSEVSNSEIYKSPRPTSHLTC